MATTSKKHDELVQLQRAAIDKLLAAGWKIYDLSGGTIFLRRGDMVTSVTSSGQVAPAPW